MTENIQNNNIQQTSQISGLEKNQEQILTKNDETSFDFRQIRLIQAPLVDKSNFIELVIEDDEPVVLFTRPRRWGKSINLTMLKYFFQINFDRNGNEIQNKFYRLFAGGEVMNLNKELIQLKPLKISFEKNYMDKNYGKNPVIYLNLHFNLNVKNFSYNTFLEKFQIKISQMFCEYEFLYDELANQKSMQSQAQRDSFQKYTLKQSLKLEESLMFLAQLIIKKYPDTYVYILIDEYDSIINKLIDDNFEKNKQLINQISIFLTNFIANVGKDFSNGQAKIIMTGISDCLQQDPNSGLNNIVIYSIDKQSEFDECFGFTQEEVGQLIDQIQNDQEKKQQILQSIEKWYSYSGQYSDQQKIYNPCSVILYLKQIQNNIFDIQPKRYWANSSYLNLLTKLLEDNENIGTFQIFTRLSQFLDVRLYIGDSNIVTEVVKYNNNKMEIFSYLLIHMGYVSLKNKQQKLYQIPNQEIQSGYLEIIKIFLNNKIKYKYLYYDPFIQTLIKGDEKNMQKYLQRTLVDQTIFFDFQHQKKNYKKEPIELSIKMFILGLLQKLTYTHIINSELELGHGRTDINIKQKRINENYRNYINGVSMNIEIKRGKKGQSPQLLEQIANEGLEQMKKKYYINLLQDNQKNIFLICIAISGKKIKIKINKSIQSNNFNAEIEWKYVSEIISEVEQELQVEDVYNFRNNEIVLQDYSEDQNSEDEENDDDDDKSDKEEDDNDDNNNDDGDENVENVDNKDNHNNENKEEDIDEEDEDNYDDKDDFNDESQKQNKDNNNNELRRSQRSRSIQQKENKMKEAPKQDRSQRMSVKSRKNKSERKSESKSQSKSRSQSKKARQNQMTVQKRHPGVTKRKIPQKYKKIQ